MKIKESEKICRTRLISDLPSSQDAFGSHERTANAIVELIQSEQGGRVIGLEGSWGSGKSTIINILTDRLGSDADIDYKIVIIDTWAHEGDPLRRTFLESLIDQLCDWLPNKKDWNENRKLLAGYWKREDTRKTSQLTQLGKFIVLTTLLVPVGLVIFNVVIDQLNPIGQNGLSIFLWLVFSVLLIFSPILASFCFWLKHKKDQRNGSAKNDQFDPWSALTNSEVKIETTETIQSPEPTSVEFEEYFAKLMEDALSSKKRRLILVLDNLDRINSDQALAIISTLQTFLRLRDHDQPPWFEKLWTVLPYAPESMRLLWDKDESNQRSQSFLDKNIQIRFNVPPPVLSDWKTFFLSLLNQAFPDHNQDEFHYAFRVFSIGNRDSIPTPRDMKLFVNQIGAIHRQHCGEIPLQHMAYYALLNREFDINEIPQKLLDGELPESDFEIILGKEIKENLAAIYFNTDKQKSRQLLLRLPIQNSLLTGDATKLLSLSNEFPIGFWEIIEDLDFKELSLDNLQVLTNIANCLKESELLLNADPKISDYIKSELRYTAESVKSWEPLDQGTGKGISNLFCLITDSYFVRPIFIKASAINLTKKFIENPSLEEQLMFIGNWAEGLEVMIAEIENLGFNDVLQDKIVTFSYENEKISERDLALVLLIYFGKFGIIDPQHKYDYLLDFGPRLENLRNHFEEILSKQFATNDIFTESIRFLAAKPDIKIDWNNVSSSISAPLKTSNPQSVPQEEFFATVKVLWEISEFSPTKDVFNDHNIVATIMHHMDVANSETRFNVVVWCMMLYFSSHPQHPPLQYNNQRSPQGHQLLSDILRNPNNYKALIKEFVEFLNELSNLNLILIIDKKNAQSESFIIACIEQIVDMDLSDGFLTTDLVIGKWKVLQNNGNEEKFKKFINCAVLQTSLVQDIQNNEFDIDCAGLYSAIAHTDFHQRNDFMEWLIRNLKNINEETWLQALKDESDLIDLLFDLLEDENYEPSLGLAFQDAFIENTKSLINGEWEPERFSEVWNMLSEALDKTARIEAQSQILDDLISKESEISENFFVLLGNKVSDLDVFSNKPNLFSRLFNPVVKEKNLEGINWIATLYSIHKANLSKLAPKHDLSLFKKRIKELGQLDPDDKLKESLDLISKYI